MMTYALLLGLVLAACSKAPRATPTPTTTDAAEDAAVTIPVAGDAATADAASKKGSTMSAETEAVLTKHYETKGWGKPLEVITYDQLPGFYQAEFADGGDYLVIVDGKVLGKKGLDAASAYMKSVDLLGKAALEAKDLTKLLLVLEALPKVSGYASPDQFYDYAAHPQLNPTLTRAVDGAKLVLHYLIPRRAGAPAKPQLLDLKRWTLSIPRSYKLAWTEEATTLDTSKP
ncbi:MAG: hypothetical protein WKG01_06985 [Kofleriaceae bacterium]